MDGFSNLLVFNLILPASQLVLGVLFVWIIARFLDWVTFGGSPFFDLGSTGMGTYLGLRFLGICVLAGLFVPRIVFWDPLALGPDLPGPAEPARLEVPEGSVLPGESPEPVGGEPGWGEGDVSVHGSDLGRGGEAAGVACLDQPVLRAGQRPGGILVHAQDGADLEQPAPLVRALEVGVGEL